MNPPSGRRDSNRMETLTTDEAQHRGGGPEINNTELSQEVVEIAIYSKAATASGLEEAGATGGRKRKCRPGGDAMLVLPWSRYALSWKDTEWCSVRRRTLSTW